MLSKGSPKQYEHFSHDKYIFILCLEQKKYHKQMTERAFPNMRFSFAICLVHSKTYSESKRSRKTNPSYNSKPKHLRQCMQCLQATRKESFLFTETDLINTCRISAKQVFSKTRDSQQIQSSSTVRSTLINSLQAAYI